jgi:titin
MRLRVGFLGTNAQGTAAVGNSEGFFIRGCASGLIVGGTAPGEGNVISGNGAGIRLHYTTNVQVQGNLIGTDYSGTQAISNTDGIYSQDGASNNTIGGTSPGAGNVIAFNSNNGITLLNGAGNSILGNSIHDNNGRT